MRKIYLYIVQIIIILSFSIKTVNAAININQDNFYLGINYSQTLTVSGSTSGNITWSSSNPEIVSVNNGIVIGKSIGTAYITASNGNSTDICKINVISSYIPVSNISLSTSSETLSLNETKKISVNINPSNASNKTIYYSSSDPNVVNVDTTGNITGKKVGTAYISINAEGKSSSLKVNVVNISSNISLKSISLPSSITLQENGTSKLNVTYNPSNATNKNIKWSSSNTRIVTVDVSGNIKGISAGTATITAISIDGNHVATSKITVNPTDKSLKSISLNKKELSLKIGDSETLNVSYNPANAENKNITWSSSDTKIAKVENGVVTAIKPGTAEIKAISEDGNREAICKITVISPPIESIAFESEEVTVYLGSVTTLNTISTPENTAINNPIWTSSDEEIATVEDGIVTAKKIGTATITVSDEEEKITASVNINVVKKPEEALLITIDGYNLNFDPNIKNYNLSIGNESSLNINVNRDESKFVIGGNRDLKNGSIITVTVNDKEKITYVININKKQNYTIYFIALISLLLFINIIRILIKNKKSK